MAPKRWGGRRLARLDKQDLLELRLCDLDLSIEGSWVEDLIERVRAELRARGLRFRGHFWISDEWFSPDGVPGVALPFYLFHPRLLRLERQQMFEVEGGTKTECLRILRHEMGHAVQHAWGLQRRRSWQRTFGASSQPYPDWYLPNPASKRFVQHLDGWYAQSHPDEDFAETFAVWLQPRSRWRREYEGWKALAKLEYVDELMDELAGTSATVTTRARPDSLPRLKTRLGEYYDKKRQRYTVERSSIYDRDLLELFSPPTRRNGGESASAFLRRHRRQLRELVARWTGGHVFTLDQVLKDIIVRCRELKLRARGSERQLKLDFAIMLAVHSMRCLYRGRGWHPL